jgi:glyoxylase-like metal-dependent hydrolase (beta-lactamase superfamily II)
VSPSLRSGAPALPRTVFADQHLLAVGNATVTLWHYDPGHTESDIAVRFGSEDVLQRADTWWNGVYPFIDYSTGGSIDGLIAATRWNLLAASRDTLIGPDTAPPAIGLSWRCTTTYSLPSARRWPA